MQVIIEPIFDILYLCTVLFLGVRMLCSARQTEHRLFGLAAVVLGCGDAFHLLPRVYALLSGGLGTQTTALGIGKCITSISMTIFYVLLFQIWCLRYQANRSKILTCSVFLLAGGRIVLCLLPQNEWTSANAPLLPALLRNLPFTLLGLLILLLFLFQGRLTDDYVYRWLWLAVALSFACYLPVVLFSGRYPTVGILMIPKTLCYVWIVFMGRRDMRSSEQKKREKRI